MARVVMELKDANYLIKGTVMQSNYTPAEAPSKPWFVSRAQANYMHAAFMLAAMRRSLPGPAGEDYDRFRVRYHEINVCRCLDELWAAQERAKELRNARPY